MFKQAVRECSICQTRFRPRMDSHTYCSQKCRSAAAAAKRPAWQPKPALERRACSNCGSEFQPRMSTQRLCSNHCREVFYKGQHADPEGEKIPSGTVGAVTELVIAADLMRKGWHVFRALSPACFCDLVAYKDGQHRFIEVRTGTRLADGRLFFPKKIAGGATEYGVLASNTGEIEYIPVE